MLSLWLCDGGDKMNIKKRIALMKRKQKKNWLRDEGFICPACAESFRYEINYNRHLKTCLAYKYGNF